jgi:predicted RNase H-like HicB family nuclease
VASGFAGSGLQSFALLGRLKNMVSIQPIRIEVEREEDGRVLAAVPELPGVMAYGVDTAEAIRKVKAIALQVLADMIDSGEEVPESLRALFAA